MKTIYVGNIPPSTTNEEIAAVFEPHGKVHEARVVLDLVTGQGRGFAMITMDPGPADLAIAALAGTSFNGRTLRVVEHIGRHEGPHKWVPHGAGGGEGLVG